MQAVQKNEDKTSTRLFVLADLVAELSATKVKQDTIIADLQSKLQGAEKRIELLIEEKKAKEVPHVSV